MFDNRKTVEYLVNKKRFCKIVKNRNGKYLSLKLGKKGKGRYIFSIPLYLRDEALVRVTLKNLAKDHGWILTEES